MRTLLLLALAAWAAAAPAWPRRAEPGYRWSFPRDHAAHPEYRTEWWYYTGHLASGARRFGYELTFFRVGIDPARARDGSAWAPHTVLFAHLALTDESRGRFRSWRRASRSALGMAGADTAAYRVWIDDWAAGLARDHRAHRLRASAEGLGLALELAPMKPPVIHGAAGLSLKSAEPGRASHYASLTRLATRGTLVVDGDSLAVAGSSWMDHEFGSDQLAPWIAGWDWFGLQLDDGTELMLYRLRRRDGGDEPVSSGTRVARDGASHHLPREAFTIVERGRWTSARSGAVYPSGWRIEVPGEGLRLELTPTLRDQELETEVTYWEGSVTVRGEGRSGPVTGRGYVELTGYAGPLPGF